jgi:small subunit ribosomal protein S4
MAVYHDARCRLCRREGMKLFLKGQRCFSDKCAFERRAMRRASTARAGDPETNGQQLREKQKARRTTGCSSASSGTFGKATLAKGVTGEVLMQMLERRLDNVVFRLGLAPSRNAARQLVRHGHRR